MKHNQSDIGKGFFFAKDLQFESTKSPSSTNHAQIGSWLQLISSASRRCKKISPGGALYCRGRVLSSLVTLSMVAPDPHRHRLLQQPPPDPRLHRPSASLGRSVPRTPTQAGCHPAGPARPSRRRIYLARSPGEPPAPPPICSLSLATPPSVESYI